MKTWPRALSRLVIVLPMLVLLVGCEDGPPTKPLARIETGMHTALILAIATDAAGRWAVTASFDKTARVWEVATGREVRVLRPPQGEGWSGMLLAVALSPNGAVVAVGGATGFHPGDVSIYLFDRADGRLLRRLPGSLGLPDDIIRLAFSPDGHWLAAILWGNNGVRVFDTTSGIETGRDTRYGAPSFGVQFSPDGRRLLTTSLDGQVRLYAVDQGKLGEAKTVRPDGGKQPCTARFSPDGRLIALGFRDSTVVQVLDADTLDQVARPDTAGVDHGDLKTVAWTADGRFLLAGGVWWDANGKHPVRRWPTDDWPSHQDLPLTNEPLIDLTPLPGGGVLFASVDPAWGMIDPDLRVVQRRDGEILHLRDPDGLRLSPDARRVRFGEGWGSADPRVFDLASRSLGSDDPALVPARTAAPGLEIKDWRDAAKSSLNGRALGLQSNSLAITPDGRGFVLGGPGSLLRLDRDGKPVWKQSSSGKVQAVNWSPDGPFVVAGYDDGIIRWHRASDGQELLALFVHPDRQRWVAWTPEGFYAASGPDAEDLLGWHLNRGKDREGAFVSARQLHDPFYQPDLVSRRLDADGDALMAQAVQQRGDLGQVLAGIVGRMP